MIPLKLHKGMDKPPGEPPPQQTQHQPISPSNKPSSSLPILKPNEIKAFHFTTDQYLLLETEYIRYTLYKETLKAVENLYKLHTPGQDNTTRKLYENKNIFDRFVLECMNHGISPHSITTINHLSQPLDISLDKPLDIPLDIDKNANRGMGMGTGMDKLRKHLFFNPLLANETAMKETPYFQKMLAEYIEKKFRYTPDKATGILKILSIAAMKYTKSLQELHAGYHKQGPGYFADKVCNWLLTDSENYIIRYQTYTKVINAKRKSSEHFGAFFLCFFAKTKTKNEV